jgi:hypothetical protein
MDTVPRSGADGEVFGMGSIFFNHFNAIFAIAFCTSLIYENCFIKFLPRYDLGAALFRN